MSTDEPVGDGDGNVRGGGNLEKRGVGGGEAGRSDLGVTGAHLSISRKTKGRGTPDLSKETES